MSQDKCCIISISKLSLIDKSSLKWVIFALFDCVMYFIFIEVSSALVWVPMIVRM